jgi:hypothetical protein
MRTTAFRWCLYVAAGCLLLAALFQVTHYVTVSIAVANSGLKPGLQQEFRALWLGAATQSFLLAVILAVAGWRPGWISRAVVVLCGLLPIASSALFYSLVGSGWGQALSGLAAAAIVLSALLWPLPGATQIAPSRQA